MPLYEYRNKETGEIEEHMVKISDREQFLEDNPHLTAKIGMPMMVTHVNSTLYSKTSGDWRDLMKKVKKGSGRGNTIKT